ncbi:NAD(P)/FAD-dependent oxidoreductase [Nocardiopsis sp. JB363]|uniref:flavin-containing monooxygenase n=1 Tax=Nocardiopsis sp. JB363 TaxID=1434837 RepID=UPI00097B8B3E|nr:NAD(P)/FAD-dependent oxidoreductase [Nocardiopsis sp. JB363]SIO88018.1 Cyclohexanone monooxygenase [Nocardiopsis sp. JB363]
MSNNPREPRHLDAVVIGAGFGGMYALHRLRDDLGMDVRAFEAGDGVGGTWYWNRYPGARCDAESILYSYSFDQDLQDSWTWSERYAAQPELLAYAEHVADRFDLRRSIDFGTRVSAAHYDEERKLWRVSTGTGTEVLARYLVTALGFLSASQSPDIDGLADFGGEVHHTGHWPHEGVDLDGKRVAVIGTGSSGIQAIPEIARQAAHLTVFQRTPHFSVPARNRPLTEEEVARVRADYPALRAEAGENAAGLIVAAAPGNAADLSPEERAAELQRRWEAGGLGFLSSFEDFLMDEDANATAAEFVRERIQETVRDARTAELLTPADYPIGTKRICLDTGYYETYNRDDVSLVSIREHPIERVTPTGVRVNGVDHEVDVIVLATGFDAFTGPYTRMDLRGRGGRPISQAWEEGPRSYLGVAVAGFPNMFTITGPGSPSALTNVLASIEQHVDWITDHIGYLEESGMVAEAEEAAQDAWVDHVGEIASYTLYPKAGSWYMGANVPGKPRVFLPYAGGLPLYREQCDKVAAEGYTGFAHTPRECGPAHDPVRKNPNSSY